VVVRVEHKSAFVVGGHVLEVEQDVSLEARRGRQARRVCALGGVLVQVFEAILHGIESEYNSCFSVKNMFKAARLLRVKLVSYTHRVR
jgi:hypothetical protein